MKAIPTSVKAQFFAMYLGQSFIITDEAERKDRGHSESDEFTVDASNIGGAIFDDSIEMDISVDACCLLLRDSSDLTDEEAITLIKIQYGIFDATGCEFTVGRNQFGKTKIQVHVHKDNKHYHSFEISVGLLHQQGIDYLRSIGIILPFTYLNEDKKPVTLSVDELIGMKWAVIKK